MFNFFKPFSRKTYVGIDIGTGSIKAVEVSAQRGEKPTLLNYGDLEGLGYLDRSNNAIQTSALKMLDREVVGLIKMLLSKSNIKTKDVVASIPPFSIFTTLIDIPMMSKSETDQAIQYQARAFVPLPPSEITLDAHKIREYEDERGVKKQEIFLIAVPNDLIKKYQNLFANAGLNLRALEIEGLSLARIATSGDPTNSLIVDIGGRSTNILIAGGGFLKHQSQTDYAGASLTQAISSGLNINVRRAEELKRQRGLIGTGGEYELSTLMSPFLDIVISEAKRVRYEFENARKVKIERVILAGGGANLKGIEEYASREFQLPVFPVNSLKSFSYNPKLEPIAKNLDTTFAVCFGLALREFM